MKKLILSFLLMLPVLANGAEQINYADIVGTYEGMVVNGGGVFSVVTEFSLLDDGRLRGEYRVNNGSDPLIGYLSGPLVTGKNRISFEWQDRDGEGFAELLFTDDYSAFDGYWGSRDSNGQFPWSGEKK